MDDIAPGNDAPLQPQAKPATPPAAAQALVIDQPTDWSSALVLAGGDVPAGEKRPVIVVETRDEKGALVAGRKYPDGQVFWRTSPDVQFGNDPARQVITLGVDIAQNGFWKFSKNAMGVHVGPALPAYGAANYAYLMGARQIEIAGLPADQKTGLRPWLDALAADPDFSDVKVTLT